MTSDLDFQQLFKNGSPVVADPAVFSLVRLLPHYAQEQPEKQALVFVGAKEGVQETLTYASLLQQVLALAAFLKHAHNVKPGDRVALNVENSPEILLFHLACWFLGAVTVPLDLKRDVFDRKQYKLHVTQCAVLITSDEPEAAAEAEKLQRVLPTIRVVPMSQEIRKNIALGEALALSEIQEDFDQTALILFTSGTTQFPKGAQLSLANLLLNADGIREWLRITPEDRFHIVLPLHHINSTTMSLATLIAGGTIVLSPRYSKSHFWRVMAEQQCTLSSIVPTICFDMLSEQVAFEKYRAKLAQVTRIQLGSAPVQPTDVLKFYDLYNIRLVQGYGSTETALRVTGVSWHGLSDEEYRELVRSNTIGSELKWNTIEILKEDGMPAKENEAGEICIRGPVLTKGYLANDEANTKAFFGGWFHSGDVGYWQYKHGNKQIFITGRMKEIIIKGGVNISPLTVEHAILKNYPDISTCYAASVPDERYGEEIGMVVAFEESVSTDRRKAVLEQLRADAAARNVAGISAYEAPHFVLEVPLSSLPTTSTGKVQRVTIKQYFSEMFSPIAETQTHLFRKITPFDTDHISRLAAIHNTRWGEALGLSEETARQATENGIVLGAIEKSTQKLVGSAFALQLSLEDMEKNVAWLSTYASATENLSLKTHNTDGNAILFVTISTDGKPFAPTTQHTDPEYLRLLANAPHSIDKYLAANSDPVLTFHRQPKAGMQEGAQIFRTLPAARPEDVEALGYCVIMKYPILLDTAAVQKSSSLGIQILEAGMMYAVQQGIVSAYAYSRPSGFLRWLKEQSAKEI